MAKLPIDIKTVPVFRPSPKLGNGGCVKDTANISLTYVAKRSFAQNSLSASGGNPANGAGAKIAKLAVSS
jgi:hypothetical protein